MSGGPHPPACPVCQADVHPAMWRRYEACSVDHGLVVEARADAAAATADEVKFRELWAAACSERDRLAAALEPFAGLLTAYLAAPSGIDAISTHVRLDDVREARRALGLPLE